MCVCASLPHPVADVYFLQAGGDNGDAVAVYAGLVSLYPRGGVAVGVELQGAAEVPGVIFAVGLARSMSQKKVSRGST